MSAKLKDFGEPAFAAFQRGSNPGVDVVFLVDDHTFRSHSGFGNREGKLLVELAALRTATLRQPSQVSLCESIKCPSGQRRQSPCQRADGRSWSFSRLEGARRPSAKSPGHINMTFCKDGWHHFKTLITLQGAFHCCCHYSAINLMPWSSVADCSIR